MIKQLHTSYSLLIALDLCQTNYQILLINYLKFTKKNAKDARKEKKSSQNVILLGLKIINYFTNVRSVEKDG